MEKRDNISELEEKDSELDPVVGEGMEENEETADTPVGECTSREVVEDLSDENEDFLEELTLDTDEASEKDSDTDEDEPEEDEPEEGDKKTAAEILAAVSRVGIIPSNEEENKRDVESSEDSFVSAGEDGEVVTTDEPEEETPADDTPDREISAADIDAELDADEASEAEELSDEEEIVEAEELSDIQPTEMTEDEILPDPAVYDTVRFVVKDLEEDGRVSCPCGTPRCELRFCDSGIQVYCESCGATHTFLVTSPSVSEELLSLDSLTLN